jgi:hypothetical protein
MAAILTRLPNLRAIAQDFLGQPYAVDDCWRLVLDLLHAGGFGDYRDKPGEAIQQVAEVWFWDDPRNPLTLIQPWDWVLLTKIGKPERGAAVGHIGLVVDDLTFVHVGSKVGVVIEPLQRWRARFVQLARWKHLT